MVAGYGYLNGEDLETINDEDLADDIDGYEEDIDEDENNGV